VFSNEYYTDSSVLSPGAAFSPRDDRRLNPRQRIEAFYIAGMDHQKRFNSTTGMPDTIAKLENGIQKGLFAYDAGMHSISALFMEREGQVPVTVDTSLTIGFIPGTSFDASSTSIRKALARGVYSKSLATLPYSAFMDINERGLYASSAGFGE
jgi:hypothetical protein